MATATIYARPIQQLVEEEALRIWQETYPAGDLPEFPRSAVWHFYLTEARRNLSMGLGR